MPGCDRDIVYQDLSVCRTCYKRIWHIARTRELSQAEAKKRLVILEKTAIALGLKLLFEHPDDTLMLTWTVDNADSLILYRTTAAGPSLPDANVWGDTEYTSVSGSSSARRSSL